MSRFKHALAARDAHIFTLRLALGVMLALILALWFGWYSAPRELLIHNPPDLRHGSTRPWWQVPPGDVYAFTFYIFQQLNRWPTNGEADYAANLQRLQPWLTPACQQELRQDYQRRRDAGELRERVRGVYEIPGRHFDNKRVEIVDRDSWRVTLDLGVDEYYRGEAIKRTLVRYPVKVVRYDLDAERNPWGLALDCLDGSPQKLAAENPEVTP